MGRVGQKRVDSEGGFCRVQAIEGFVDFSGRGLRSEAEARTNELG